MCSFYFYFETNRSMVVIRPVYTGLLLLYSITTCPVFWIITIEEKWLKFFARIKFSIPVHNVNLERILPNVNSVVSRKKQVGSRDLRCLGCRADYN